VLLWLLLSVAVRPGHVGKITLLNVSHQPMPAAQTHATRELPASRPAWLTW
jgi:hypothetical protein